MKQPSTLSYRQVLNVNGQSAKTPLQTRPGAMSASNTLSNASGAAMLANVAGAPNGGVGGNPNAHRNTIFGEYEMYMYPPNHTVASLMKKDTNDPNSLRGTLRKQDVK